jgi:FkbM family methyltransferase
MRSGFLHHSLCRIGVYRKARLVRRRILEPALWRRSNRLMKLYGEFIRPGDIVFDVGANRGDRTDIFARLRARVIAVEPNQELATRLRWEFRFASVAVEPLALGGRTGILPMRHCNLHEMSSLSDRWIDAVQKSRFPELEWNWTEMVPVTTLDNLVRQHGTPAFVKLDVEGYEAEVLAGLSLPLRALSFEATPECLEVAADCCTKLSHLGEYEFNVSRDEGFELELPHWSEAVDILKLLENNRGAWTYADVYARKVRRHPATEENAPCPRAITTT